MSSEEIKSVIGTNEAGNKIFISIYENKVQYYTDTNSSTVTAAVYEDAKAGRKLVDTIRVRMESDFLSGSLGLTAETIKSNDEPFLKSRIVTAALDAIKLAYRKNRGTFTTKEIVCESHKGPRHQAMIDTTL